MSQKYLPIKIFEKRKDFDDRNTEGGGDNREASWVLHMTPSNKEKWLPSNRKWYLKIDGLYRDFIEKEAARENYQLSQEYCLILTIRDPEKEAPVYDEVTQQLTNRNFIHHDVLVRNIIQVTARSDN